MAFNATAIAEVQSGGSDTNNAGFFDPALVGTLTDLAATSGNTSSPVVSSASYSFVAGDVGAWVFVKSGSNWIPGWYKVTAVSGGSATLDATAGHAILYSSTSGGPAGQSTANGCATTASPTGGTWGIDYSQQTSPAATYTSLTGDAISGVLHGTGFTKVMVGNSLHITGGTSFTTGVYMVTAFTSSTSIQLDRSFGPSTASGGTAKLGGALASPGFASSLLVGGNWLFIKQATFSITSASTNVSGGCLSLPAGTTTSMTTIQGYNTRRFDNGTAPTLQASGISSFALIKLPSAGCVDISNLTLDGNSLTSSLGVDGTVNTTLTARCYRLTVKNCTTHAFSGPAGLECILCGATGCSGTAWLGCSSLGCVAYSNTFSGWNLNATGCVCVDCLAVNNSGAHIGFFAGATGVSFTNCTAYNNGGDGFQFMAAAGTVTCINCIAENNGGYGFNASAAYDGISLYLCAGYNNTSGLVNNSNIFASRQIGLITCTAEIFTNTAGNDFTLNNNTGGGAACRAAGMPGSVVPYLLPGLSTNAYPDLGAVQHQATSGGGTVGWVSIG